MDDIQIQVKQLKLDIKAWEHDFAKREGRKPEKADVAKENTIASKYKAYAKLKTQAVEQSNDISVEPEKRKKQSQEDIRNISAKHHHQSAYERGAEPGAAPPEPDSISRGRPSDNHPSRKNHIQGDVLSGETVSDNYESCDTSTHPQGPPFASKHSITIKDTVSRPGAGANGLTVQQAIPTSTTILVPALDSSPFASLASGITKVDSQGSPNEAYSGAKFVDPLRLAEQRRRERASNTGRIMQADAPVSPAGSMSRAPLYPDPVNSAYRPSSAISSPSPASPTVVSPLSATAGGPTTDSFADFMARKRELEVMRSAAYNTPSVISPSSSRPQSSISTTTVTLSDSGGTTPKTISTESLTGDEVPAPRIVPPHQNPPPAFDGAAAAKAALTVRTNLHERPASAASTNAMRNEAQANTKGEIIIERTSPGSPPGILPTFPASPSTSLKGPSSSIPYVNADIFRRVAPGEVLLCKVYRKTSVILGKVHPTFFVYNESDNRFLVSARKRKKAKSAIYLISTSADDLTKDSKTYVGKLRGNFQGTNFVLYDARTYQKGKNDKGLIEHAGILYSKDSLPREMLVGIPAKRLSREVVEIPKPELDAGSNILADMSSMNRQNLTYFKNKAPKWNEATQSHCLNFSGRVTVPSIKNFQIVDENDENAIVLQFGRTGTDAFTMDIRYPFCLWEGFAVALSSFDAYDSA